jgi:hypothetical protein
VTDFKSLLIEKIENQRKEQNEKLNALITSAEQSEDYIDTFVLLQKYYGNTIEQAELQIQLLKENLTSKFFTENTPERHPNYITYENEDFAISFATFASREIIAKHKKGWHCFPLAKGKFQYQDFYDVLMIYKNKPSFANLKEVINVDYKNSHSKKIWLLKYLKIKDALRNGLIENIQQRFDDYNKQKAEDKIKQELFEKDQKMAREFFDSIPELKDFVNKGFRIRYKGISNNGSFEW